MKRELEHFLHRHLRAINDIMVLFALIFLVYSTTVISDQGIFTDKLNQIYFVQENNGTDIQQKIDDCPSSGCKIVIPSGTYYVDQILIDTSNITLEGAGDSTRIFLKDDSNKAALKLEDVEHVVVRQMYINGNAPNNPKSHGIEMRRVNYTTIEYVTVENVSNKGIYLSGHSGGTANYNIIQHNVVHGAGTNGIDLYIRVNHTKVYDNYVSDVGYVGILGIRDVHHNIFESNYVFRTYNDGIQIRGHEDAAEKSTYNVIKDNYVYYAATNNLAQGIFVNMNTENTLIDGNFVYGSGANGIETTENSWNVFLTGNYVYKSGLHAFENQKSTGALVGNYGSGSGSTDYATSSFMNMYFMGNVEGSTESGIVFDRGDSVSLDITVKNAEKAADEEFLDSLQALEAKFISADVLSSVDPLSSLVLPDALSDGEGVVVCVKPDKTLGVCSSVPSENQTCVCG
ncbi:right-handed parallel beta-helix repeat-containing protein [Candidatus Woesearchaeota archaeon]|nr:right-handed parallel beta-helix repeat-containing protein [Nanoarchaeota archaeon]MCB9371105.1 right-handed parallel beta-helix repeat-containing protein [Candidatus Woesearchaeota archaeon]USN44178.1 MAG: right-handed parallel beta-helix repeat-containing protein [Candidatus Woesearchaeota archaeon]